MYQRLPVVISGGWYTYVCNVDIFMYRLYIIIECRLLWQREGKNRKLNCSFKGRKEKKGNLLAEIYSLCFGER